MKMSISGIPFFWKYFISIRLNQSKCFRPEAIRPPWLVNQLGKIWLLIDGWHFESLWAVIWGGRFSPPICCCCCCCCWGGVGVKALTWCSCHLRCFLYHRRWLLFITVVVIIIIIVISIAVWSAAVFYHCNDAWQQRAAVVVIEIMTFNSRWFRNGIVRGRCQNDSFFQIILLELVEKLVIFTMV